MGKCVLLKGMSFLAFRRANSIMQRGGGDAKFYFLSVADANFLARLHRRLAQLPNAEIDRHQRDY